MSKFAHDMTILGLGIAFVLLATAIDLILRFGGFWSWSLFVVGMLTYLGVTGGPALFKYLDTRWG